MNKKVRQGKTIMLLGGALIAVALCLAAYSLYGEKTAENSISMAGRISSVIAENTKETAENEIPDYVLNPKKKLPVKEIDGEEYIGTLDIYALDLSLSVMDDWDYRKLKISPCRYTGSPYEGNLIIAAHHYESHFGSIDYLEPGDKLAFTDMDGNSFNYEVAYIELLEETDTEKMQSGDWDLTIFTCTYDTQRRVTVRAKRV